MRELLQERLDVTNKSRSNIFNWRGQFTPQFVDYILEEFATNASAVIDPFCGSGTVLLEAASRNIAGFGIELNPAAYAMAKFSTLALLDLRQRLELSRQIESHINSTVRTFGGLPLWNESSDYRAKAANLLNFARTLLDKSETKKQTLLSTLLLFEAESTRCGDLLPVIRRSHQKLTEQLVGLPRLAVSPQIFLCDARLAAKVVPVECDFLLTSPPYINVFNYHQNHRAIVELLGFDILSVARCEIGSNRKNRGNRFRTVVQYCLEMERALTAFNQILKNSGYAIMILGRESNVRGVPFKNGELVYRIATEGGLFALESQHERSFTNRFGTNIVEDILVFRKAETATASNVARTIAGDALQEGLRVAEKKVVRDIEDAINNLDQIPESPIQDRTPIL
ncbi:DNA methyltransferase [Allochromatium vinosum]|uniref:DNA methylase N-4/N-6 domain protein n=1 Tax=Allochromatium vinosum (strain ATCC 17899 / DSM 180 / NBRC 103801 / NCIMB 10441 / D) TaxID=572477 RepID=D3RTN7_ALLVD|nr:DNA methyltransferase [Allochromatium vinosum]ADC62546.1 DNA methylase N-4/N-6 domain protein [Allochromatium vinosum DSM 180]